VRNWGTAFEPQTVPVPDVESPLEQRQMGGLGLYLVRQVMDSLSFEFDAQKGNVVTMIKRYRAKEGEV
jgi:anti-sigma regulatory factor (Ser/Thr protein kinase)